MAGWGIYTVIEVESIREVNANALNSRPPILAATMRVGALGFRV